MPELPQTQPSTGVRVPGVVGVSPGATGNQLAEGAETVGQQAIALQHQLDNIDRYAQFHDAAAKYISGSADIFDNAKSIQDPEVRRSAIINSTEELSKSIAEDHPNAGPELASHLAGQVAADRRRAGADATILAHDNAVGNIAALTKETGVAYAKAKDDSAAAFILQNYNKTIDSYMFNGAISAGDAAKYKADAKYQASLAAFDKQIAANPIVALSIPLEKSNLTAPDWLARRYQAYGEEKRQNDTANLEYQSEVNQANLNILHGNWSDAQVEQAYETGVVTPRMYEYHFHHEPSNVAAANNILATLDNGIFNTPESVDVYNQEHILNRTDLRPPDMRRISAKVASLKSDLSTDVGTAGRDIGLQTVRKIKEIDPGLWMVTGINPPDRQEETSDFAIMKNEISGAKTVSEKQAIADRYLKKWQDRLGGKAGTAIPAHGGTTPGWMGASPKSMATPTPEDFLSKDIPRD